MDYALPEFDVVEHGDGSYTATHKSTGALVTARTWQALVTEATALRIAWSLRSGGVR